MLTENIHALSYVKRSKNRKQVVKLISTSTKTPSEITEELNLRFSLVSAILADLKKENIIICLNENEKKGRIYKLTDVGLDIYDEL
jgi:predicted transcriptional regulator